MAINPLDRALSLIADGLALARWAAGIRFHPHVVALPALACS